MNGSDSHISTNRCPTKSVFPPKYPCSAPAAVPSAIVETTSSIPNVIDVLSACSIRAATSRPDASMPSGCPRIGRNGNLTCSLSVLNVHPGVPGSGNPSGYFGSDGSTFAFFAAPAASSSRNVSRTRAGTVPRGS